MLMLNVQLKTTSKRFDEKNLNVNKDVQNSRSQDTRKPELKEISFSPKRPMVL